MNGRFFNPDTGKKYSGGAAQLRTIKNNGGWEEHHRKLSEAVAKAVAEEVTKRFLEDSHKEMRKDSFKVI